MRELMVPPVLEDPFREHYRELILGTVLRAAEAQSARDRARGHRLRARRAERVAERLRPAPLAAPPPPEPLPVVESERAPAPVAEPAPVRVEVEYERWFGPRIRTAARLVWFATLALLVADIAVLGIDSLTTSAADLGLVSMTIVWFCVGIDDLIAPAGSGVQRPHLYG
jgi:hypothetical protein